MHAFLNANGIINSFGMAFTHAITLFIRPFTEWHFFFTRPLSLSLSRSLCLLRLFSVGRNSDSICQSSVIKFQFAICRFVWIIWWRISSAVFQCSNFSYSENLFIYLLPLRASQNIFSIENIFFRCLVPGVTFTKDVVFKLKNSSQQPNYRYSD